MRRLLILTLPIILLSHSKIKLMRYFTYYKLGYEYAKSVKDKDRALKMCSDTVGSVYLDSKYKGACLYGVNEAIESKEELSLDKFLESKIHERF